MKKITLAIFGIFLGLLISGCSKPETVNPYLAWEPPKENPRERVIVTPVVLRSDQVIRNAKPIPLATMPKVKVPDVLLEPRISLIEVSISEQKLRAYSISKEGLKPEVEFKCSTALSGINYPKNIIELIKDKKLLAETHNHTGEFTIDKKDPNHISGQFGCPMPYALHFFEGHWIHATEPKYYPLLGQPASHGCVRLTLQDAKWLFCRVAPNKCVLTVDL